MASTARGTAATARGAAASAKSGSGAEPRGQGSEPLRRGSAPRGKGEDDEPGPLFLAVSYALLLVLGIVLALLGSFLLPAGPHVGTRLVLPIGLVIALIGHPLAGVAGLWLTDTRTGTLTALIGWSIVILPFSSGTAEGDVVLPGTLLTVVYLLLGVLTFGAVAVVTHPKRGRSALGRR